MKELKNFKSSNNNKILFILPIEKIEQVFLNECVYSLAEQEELVDLLVLSNELNDNDQEILKNTLENPWVERAKPRDPKNPNQQEEFEMVSGKNKINYIIQKTQKTKFNEIFNEGFNYAIDNNYEWFSFIEHDDFVNRNWLRYFNIYSREKNFDALLPLTKETAPMGFSGFMNEASWVEGFAEVAGTFDLNLILRFNCMNVTGAIYKTESIKNYSEEIGGEYKPMKESMKINYGYEFFLRMIYNDLKFFTIPRLGYDHRINRISEKFTYFSSKLPIDLLQKSSSQGGITQEEHKFWMDLAKKEYFFENDRKKAFEQA